MRQNVQLHSLFLFRGKADYGPKQHLDSPTYTLISRLFEWFSNQAFLNSHPPPMLKLKLASSAACNRDNGFVVDVVVV